MIFTETKIKGAYLIDLEKKGDDRGFFARFFCEKEFAAHGLVSRFVQINTSFTAKKGTLRGLHYQLPPAGEVKLMRCLRGAVLDLIVDLRPDSPSYMQWLGVELTEENRAMFYVPVGCAHSVLTLRDDTEILYPVSAFYAPDKERGLRFDDPILGIKWPVAPVEISDKDKRWPDFDPAYHGVEEMRGMS